MLPFSIPPEVLATLQTIVLALTVYFALFSLALAIWTFRDSRRRTSNWLVHISGVALVLVFNLPGLLLYMLVRPGETLAQQYDRSLEEAVILQDLEKQLACPRCKRGVQPDFLVCPHCTTQLRRACHKCGAAMSAIWKACPYCATPAAIPTPAPIREAATKQLDMLPDAPPLPEAVS